ncbi:alcohol oxidase [Suillus clintonianus]|uniref:alcohol oxidase n=1 Tax=Suillus clintonianus TaxID=1904413 RepID=UPI001B85BAB9|nr:alcohol oxidase [Suillus clintonianus]KAG2151485.1 alcohol oxidase [Suillus clintonianus]
MPTVPVNYTSAMPIHQRPADVGAETRFLDTNSPRKGLYDYIIVGGGTAGCVLASRLTEDPNISVLLLERGGVHNTFIMRCPLLSGSFLQGKHPSVRWNSTPLTAANGRVLEILTGTVLGGASRFNAMVYTRGSAAQYDEWRKRGRVGWSYADLEPYFIKSENAVSTPGNHHGSGGPWSNQHFDKFHFSSFPRTAKAARDLGISYTEDVNAPEGSCISCAKLHVTMTPDGKRLSTLDAFLPPSIITQRQRLDICTDTLVTKIDFEHDGVQAVASGVFFKPFDSPATEKILYARAKKEIIVCCGAIETPHLLLLSGIGAKDHISKHGIKVIKDLPGVGHNLQDHAGVTLTYKVPLSDSFHSLESSLTRALTEFLNYLIWGRGLFTNPTLQVSIFAKSDNLGSDAKPSFDPTNREAFPDIEIMPIPVEINRVATQKSQGFFSFLCVPLQPKSSGTIELHSHNPHASPKVDLGFFTDATDFNVARKALRLAMKLAEKMRADGYQMEDHLVPAGDSDEQLDTFIRQGARTTFHYASSCRMAPEHDTVPGVIDDELRVHGISHLRIADASIFPDVVATHLQAPVVMVAEKCADMLKQTWSATIR